MTQPILEYAAPARWKPQWQYLRFSVAVLLYVFGWFCFSLYLWHLFGSLAVGRMPPLRLVRNLCAPRIVAATLVATGLNCAYLIYKLISRKQPVAAWLLYLILAILPVAALAANEFCFGDFIVE
jgi:hypothetical protein